MVYRYFSQLFAETFFHPQQARNIRQIIITGTVSENDREKISPDVINALKNPEVRHFIYNRSLTVSQLIHASYLSLYALQTVEIIYMIEEKKLTALQVLNANSNAALGLIDSAIRKLIDQNKITIDQVLSLSNGGLQALTTPEVRQLVDDNLLPINQLISISPEVSLSLQCHATQKKIKDGELTAHDILSAHKTSINNHQSTHTNTVHKTASNAALKLKDYYQSLNVFQILKKITEYTENLSPKTRRSEAAKRCLDRLLKTDFQYIEPVSKISLKELVALVFTAIHDDSKRTGSLSDALEQFVEGLYEIQRGYNLSKTGEDNHGADAPICSSGTFNKLIEKLQGIHMDIQIQYVTPEIATYKLPIVVRQIARDFLNEHDKDPSLPDDITMSWMWPQIRSKISEKMYREFHSLYKNPEDKIFKDFIDYGQYVNISEIINQHKNFQNLLSHHSIFEKSSLDAEQHLNTPLHHQP